MVCSYRPSLIDLPIAIIDFQVGVCPYCLHHLFRGECVILNYIFFDGEGRKIFYDCVDKIGGGASQIN